jgi:predicted tellurium resistance membrane protein TerC
MSRTVFDFHALMSGEGLISLVSLVALEIVLGIDNIVVLAILSERIDVRRRSLLRRLGLGLALILRLGLLGSLSWMMRLSRPLLSFGDVALSGRDLVLLGGGLFLMTKSVHELFRRTEETAAAAEAGAPSGGGGVAGGAGAGGGATPGAPTGNFGLLLAQILILDIVFSLDSVITAVGMARQISIMMVAMVIAVGIMLAGANIISDFIGRHPSLKVLALSFLLMVGVLLVADAFGKHIGKGYLYFAMAYALTVELFNIRRRQKIARRG